MIVSSIVGKRGVPYMGAYSATKFAQVGLAECLRSELHGSDIHVSVVCPVSTPTEFADVMSRETGGDVSALARPAQSVEDVADAIARAIEHPVPRSIRTSSRAGWCCRTPSRRASPIGSCRSSAGKPIAGSGMTDDAGALGRAPRAIATAVRDAGGRALFVGGCVRDRLMGRDSKDIDIEVFGMPADACGAARIARPRRDRRRELPGLQARRHRRLAAAPRVEVGTRAQRIRRHRRSRR